MVKKKIEINTQLKNKDGKALDMRRGEKIKSQCIKVMMNNSLHDYEH